jgi:hypothetical protein
MWSSPLKEKKVDKEKQLKEEFKKPKCRISKGSVKKLTDNSVDSTGCIWFERWLEQLVRENSYPPQLISDDFFGLLNRFFPVQTANTIIEKAKHDYALAFPVLTNNATIPKEFDINSLYQIMSDDPIVKSDFPFLFS